MPRGVYKRTEAILEKLRIAHSGERNLNYGKPAWNRGRIMPKESREKISKAVKGNKHYRWIKDRSKLKKDPRKDLDTQYKYWMREVKNRDKWQCRLLNSDCRGRLESHHIFNWIDYPELRYIITNGITLCRFHHPRKWEEEKRLIPIFQELVSVSKE